MRFLLFTVLLLIACLSSGIYGVLHNQVSYTVSPEYFTCLKFEQFKIPNFLQNRIGASLVGWRASWWMGGVIGIIVLTFGLLVRDDRAYFSGMLRVFLIVCATAFVVGLFAFILSFVLIRPSGQNLLLLNGNLISDPVAFRRAGMLHNFGYIGGLLGIVSGCWFIYCLIVRDERPKFDYKDVVSPSDRHVAEESKSIVF